MRRTEHNTGSMSIAKRTHNQVALKEKELKEKNATARLVALGKHRKVCAKKKGKRPENDEEIVKVVTEAEYMRRVCKFENRESSRNTDLGSKGNSHDSVEVVAEKWNPLGVPFDNDDVENIGEQQSDASVGSEWPPMESGSEGIGGFSDNHRSGSLQPDFVSDYDLSSSSEDDSVSDEDFRVDDEEKRKVDDSGESGGYDDTSDYCMEDRDRESDLDDRYRESVLDDTVVGDDEYMQWLDCHYDVDNYQTNPPENIETVISDGSGTGNEAPQNIDVEIGLPPDVLCGSENAGNKESCSPTENKKARIESEFESESVPKEKVKSEKSSSSENGSSKRTKRPEGKNIVVRTAEGDDEEYVKWISCQYHMDIIRDESQGKIDVKIEHVSESENIPERRLPKTINVGIEPKIENDWPEELRTAQNSGNKKRGRTSKQKHVVRECEETEETSFENDWSEELSLPERRLPKTINVGIEPKIKNDWPEELRTAQNSGNKKRGRTLKQKHVVRECEETEETLFENDWSEELSTAKNCGNKKRARTSKHKHVVREYEDSSFAH